MTSDQRRAYQVGGHYKGVRFRITVWLVYGRHPFVRLIEIAGMAPVVSPKFDITPATVSHALDIGFRRACDTIAAA